jgi:hypothetical protein
MSQQIVDRFNANYKFQSPENIAVDVLRNNTYCVLSTVTTSAEPWTTPVRYQCDEQGNLYWTSARNARHSQLISENQAVSAVVIDLRFISSVSSAVYFSGTAREIPYAELPQLIRWRYPEGKRTIQDFDPQEQHRSVYRLQTKSIWCLAAPDIINGVATDKRVPVDIQQPQKLMRGENNG